MSTVTAMRTMMTVNVKKSVIATKRIVNARTMMMMKKKSILTKLIRMLTYIRTYMLSLTHTHTYMYIYSVHSHDHDHVAKHYFK